MPRLLLAVLISASVPVTAGYATDAIPPASSLVVQWDFDQSTLSFATLDSFDVVQLSSANSSNEFDASALGAPTLPMHRTTVLLPPGHTIDHVATTSTPVSQGVGYYLRPVQHSAPTDSTGVPEWVPPDQTIYGSSVAWPAEPVVVVGESQFRHYRIATLEVSPVQYVGFSGGVSLNTSVVATLSLRPLPDAERAAIPISMRPVNKSRVREDMKLWISDIVENPDDLADYYAESTGQRQPLARPAGAFRPTELPSLEGPPVEYVIVTSAELAAGFEAYADWKTRIGIPTVIRTVDWIEANYSGLDTQERIRHFLRDAYVKWGALYALLGGDASVVPYRFMRLLTSQSFLDPPVDFYYADLTASWNDNGNDVFGEGTDGSDVGPELLVGRASVRTPGDVATFVKKVSTYARDPGGIVVSDQNYHGRVVLMAGLTNSCNWAHTLNNGLRNSEIIAGNLEALPTPPSAIRRLYQNIYFDPDPEAPCSSVAGDDPACLVGGSSVLEAARLALCPHKDEIRQNQFDEAGMTQELNAGAGFVFHVEHSFANFLGGPSGSGSLGGGSAACRACVSIDHGLPSGERALFRGAAQVLSSDGMYSIVYSRGATRIRSTWTALARR